MSTGLRAEWNHHCATAADTRDFALENAELRRIDEIVGRVHREERCANIGQRRTRIVIAGRLHRIEHIVRIISLSEFGDVGIKRRVRQGERGVLRRRCQEIDG